jgi:hypothetical protein
MTIIVLLAAIWFAGFYGYAKLRDYSRLIRGTKDGSQVEKITTGLLLVVLWLPVSAVISAILNYCVTKNAALLPAVTIIENYISLIFPLVGFVFISVGARGLSELVRQRPSQGVINAMVLLLVYVGLVYYRFVATTPNRDAVYHLHIWFILATIAAPYIFMWFTGLLASYEIYHYRQKAAGVVYRKSWSMLAIGLVWLIMTSFVLQYLTSLSARLAGLSIYWLLVIVYSLLLVLGVGFVLIALGARKLQKIEEV